LLQNGERVRVLVVDDEKSIADTLALIFTLKGFEAVAAYSGEGALRAAEKLKPNVLISDVVMGGMSGIETAIQVLKDLPTCRILLISGQALTVDHYKAADINHCRFEIFNKPVPPQVLIDYLDRCA